MRAAVLLLLSVACDHTVFRDCAVSCTAESGCPSGFTCGPEGLCRAAGVSATCDDVLVDAAPDAPPCTDVCMPEDFATGQDGARSLALDATHVYWTNELAGTVMRRTKAPGLPEV